MSGTSVQDHKEVFNQIYRENRWGFGSGSGSTVENTNQYRWFVQNFIRSNKIRSIVDIGCGDWQFSKLIDWSGINYIGLDVSDVVLENTRIFARPGISFQEANALKDPLPQADLAILKDVIQHWTNAEILEFWPKLQNFKMALITNGLYPGNPQITNMDIQAGQWRPVDLTIEPFNLKGNYVHWFDGGEPKTIFLWTAG